MFSFSDFDLNFKPIFHQKLHLCWGSDTNKNETDNLKLTCKPNPCIPNVKYIRPARVGAHVGCSMVRVGCAMLFRYQHVGIGIAKVSHWGLCPTRSPNARGICVLVEYGLYIKKTSPNTLTHKIALLSHVLTCLSYNPTSLHKP